MGNPDLIVIVNNSAFVVLGKEYINRTIAVNCAIMRFKDKQIEIDKSRHNPDMTLREDADPNWFPEEIETISIYIKEE